MNQINYQKELEKILEQVADEDTYPPPTLFLHICCAP